MKFHFRKTWKPGPFRISLTEKGANWGIRAGRYGYSPKTGTHTFDTPGLGGLRWGGRRRSAKGGSSRGLGIVGLLKGLLMFALLGVLVVVVLSGWPG